MLKTEERWMQEALREAEKALKKKEVPVGAVVVYDNKIIGRGYNQIESLKDATAHAEILAITAASNYLESWRLNEATLYVTLEPCPMCAGAIILSRIKRVVYGTQDIRFGACGSYIDLFKANPFDKKIQIVDKVLEDKCLSILKEFFKNARQKKKEGDNFASDSN